MKLLSRFFRPAPAPAAMVVEPPPPPPEPAPPPVDPEEQQRLLRAIESGAVDAAELMRLAVEGQTTRIRQAAAAAVNDPASWQALLPRLRGRDKAAYKLVKGRVDAQLAEQRRQEQVRSEAEALCASMERFATKLHDSLSAASLTAFTARWQAVPELDADLRQRGESALARCRESLAAYEQEIARLAAEREAEQARLAAQQAELQAQQRAAEEQAAAQAREQAAAEQSREAEAQAAAQALSEKQAAESQAHGEILSLIRLCGAALGRGESRKAARFRQSIETAVAEAPPLPPHLARSLEQLDARLNQLRQWKDFAAAPKRIELIEEVEALIGVDEPPESLVEHLRALRQEWRTINKGIDVEATAESERFEAAYAAAFQPCQAWLAEQAAIRRNNLEARRQVLERVKAFEAGLDAERPDHPAMARVLREAPQEWRRHSPVERDAGRALDVEFFGRLDGLRARVNAWHEENAAAKQGMITRATQLAAQADLSRAIDEVKRLQAQWKTIGPVPHSRSQAMWDEFRAACNAVFARRQQEIAQLNETLGQAKAAAEELCGQIEQACGQGPADRPSGEASLREWEDAFNALGELPRAEARSLRDRYQRAVAKYSALINGLAQREAEAAEASVFTAARHVRAYQRAVLRGDADRDALKAAAVSYLDSVARWPGKAILQALRQGISRAEQGEFAQGDDAAREQALRRLCIRAEILGGRITPPEDAGLRREMELQLLSQGLGQVRQADERAWEALRLEWLGLDAAEPDVHDALEQRFTSSLKLRRREQRSP